MPDLEVCLILWVWGWIIPLLYLSNLFFFLSFFIFSGFSPELFMSTTESSGEKIHVVLCVIISPKRTVLHRKTSKTSAFCSFWFLSFCLSLVSHFLYLILLCILYRSPLLLFSPVLLLSMKSPFPHLLVLSFFLPGFFHFFCHVSYIK